MIEGQFTRTLDSPDDDAYVTLPEFDGGRSRTGPVIWQPRVADDGGPLYPAKGDTAYLEESNFGQWVVIGWEPAALRTGDRVAVEVWRDTNQTIPNGTTPTVIEWEEGAANSAFAATFWDPDDPTKISLRKAGMYSVALSLDWAGQTTPTGRRYARIRKHYGSSTAGAVEIPPVTVPNIPTRTHLVTHVIANWQPDEGDDLGNGPGIRQISVEVLQTSGGNLDVLSQFDSEAFSPCLMIAYLGTPYDRLI